MKSTRNTQQKKIILDALKHSDHPTATELHEQISKQYPTISRATVFRVLAQYSEKGDVNKFSMAEDSARYDAFTAPHAHIRCLSCGRLFDVYDKQLEEVLSKKQIGGFTVCSSNLELVGYCKECKKTEVN